MGRRFKSDSQRKAVMAKLNNRHLKIFHPIQDADKDGVINRKDCRPLNPKKQGILHEFNIRRLKAREEKLEQKRQKEQRKLDDLTDELKARNAVSKKQLKVKQAQLKQKQAIIDETNREQKELQRIKKLQREADKAIKDQTLAGKLQNKAVAATKDFKRRWNDPKEVSRRKKNAKKAGKVIKRIGKELGF